MPKILDEISILFLHINARDFIIIPKAILSLCFIDRICTYQKWHRNWIYDLDILALPRALPECQALIKQRRSAMNLSKATEILIDYHKTRSKKNTVWSYPSVNERFCQDFGDTEIEQFTPYDILSFLNNFTNGNKPYTNASAIHIFLPFSIFSATTSIPHWKIRLIRPWSENCTGKGWPQDGKSSKKNPLTRSFSEPPKTKIGWYSNWWPVPDMLR